MTFGIEQTGEGAQQVNFRVALRSDFRAIMLSRETRREAWSIWIAVAYDIVAQVVAGVFCTLQKKIHIRYIDPVHSRRQR